MANTSEISQYDSMGAVAKKFKFAVGDLVCLRVVNQPDQMPHRMLVVNQIVRVTPNGATLAYLLNKATPVGVAGCCGGLTVQTAFADEWELDPYPTEAVAERQRQAEEREEEAARHERMVWENIDRTLATIAAEMKVGGGAGGGPKPTPQEVKEKVDGFFRDLRERAAANGADTAPHPTGDGKGGGGSESEVDLATHPGAGATSHSPATLAGHLNDL